MKAHEILNEKDKWLQGCDAKNRRGSTVSPPASDAVCFCVIGAIERAYGDDPFRVLREKLDQVICALGKSRPSDYVDLESEIAKWNDSSDRTYDEVHSLLVELDI